MKTRELFGLITSAIVAATLQPARAGSHESAKPASMRIATGQNITPTALPGSVQQLLNPGLPQYPSFVAGEAVRSRLSPDGTTLAVLCAGQNSLDDAAGNLDVANSTQYIFLYDVSGSHKRSPALTQVIKQTNSHVGLVFSPDGMLYAAGGRDDAVYVYAKAANTWGLVRTIALGHANRGVGIGVSPNASGLAISADGRTLVVVNNYNDSISVVDTSTRTVRYDHDLRPFFTNNEGTDAGVGGTFPFAVVVKGNGTAYVSSDRDREVVVVDISSPTAGRLIKRIKLDGNGMGMTLDASGSRLFVAEDNADRVAGLIPTAYDPHDVTFSSDGGWMYVVNGKSVTGPNPGHLASSTNVITMTFPGGPPAGPTAAVAARASNQYHLQLERASLVSAPVPRGDDLERLTMQVAANNFYSAARDRKSTRLNSSHLVISYAV